MCGFLCQHTFSILLGQYQGAYGESIFSFARKPELFQSGTHQQRMRIPEAPHPHLHLVLAEFQILAILTGVQRCLLVYICISIITCDWSIFSHAYLPSRISSLVRCLVKSFAHFLNYVVHFLSFSLFYVLF